MTAKEKALFIAQCALEKKAEDLVILDLQGVTSLTDFFVICNGTSTRNVQGIAEFIRREMKEKKMSPWHSDGQRDGMWVVHDFGDVIAHVFYPVTRKYYDLDSLWQDAARVSFDE